MIQIANPVTLLASSLGEEGHKVAKGVQANWIHRGAPRPANPVRRHPAKSVWTRERMIMIRYGDVTAERRHYNTHCPLKGSLCIASLGGRRLAVRTAMEHPIGALPRTPFPASRDFPSRGNEKIGGTGYCVTYDTDSQSRNAPCVPFRGRGPRSGEGMYEGKNDYDTRCGRDRRRRHYKTHCPLKGKRLTTFCASLALLHPLLSLTHWIFRSLMLPYKSSSHSANCVRCTPKGNPQPSCRRRVKPKNPRGDSPVKL